MSKVEDNAFSRLHPSLLLLFFTIVIGISMFCMHPVIQMSSFISAITYSVLLKGKRAIRFNIVVMLPFLLIMALMNPLFNHAGVTILFYLKSGNPVTLESIAYGISSATMFVTVIIWFSCFHVVMTSEKLMYLFGRVMPSLSLIFAMVLRFVPRYILQIKKITEAQKSLGAHMHSRSLLKRLKHGINILSIMLTWALENAVETSDSMRARGYGLKGRTHFHRQQWDRRDWLLGLSMGLLSMIVFIGFAFGVSSFRFFPSILYNPITFKSIIIFFAFNLFCLLPVILNVMEALQWKFIESRM